MKVERFLKIFFFLWIEYGEEIVECTKPLSFEWQLLLLDRWKHMAQESVYVFEQRKWFSLRGALSETGRVRE